jgi:hypothetical protein
MRAFAIAKVRLYNILAIVALVCASLVVVVATAAAGGHAPTKGPIPPEAFREGLPIDGSLVPDFIPALGHHGEVVGYVPKELAVLDSEPGHSFQKPVAPDIPVFADDLTTLVGTMVPGKGFVPIGVDAATIEGPPVEAFGAP